MTDTYIKLSGEIGFNTGTYIELDTEDDDVSNNFIGLGTKTISFYFNDAMDYDTSYSLVFEEGALTDYEGNPFIELVDAGLYQFRTELNFPELVSIVPNFNSELKIQDNEDNGNIIKLYDISMHLIKKYIYHISNFYLKDISNNVTTILIIQQIQKYNISQFSYSIY